VLAGTSGRGVPLTCPHNVGIVLSNSYMVMVKPCKESETNWITIVEKHTINFVVVLHEYERVIVDIAMEVNVRPNPSH
jgi:hypothetical protein